MNRVFFNELELPKPDHHLGIGSLSRGEQIGRMLTGIEWILLMRRPSAIVVPGDTNSALVGDLTADKLCIPAARVEARLRSYDRIHIAGNTIADANQGYAEHAQQRSGILYKIGLSKGEYSLLTYHRPSNTDDLTHFAALMDAVADIEEVSGFPLVLPIHPRLGENQRHAAARHRHITLTGPVGYLDMLALLPNATLILTDSGGVLPAGLEASELRSAAQALLRRPVAWTNPFGDGFAYRRILDGLTATADRLH